jgi:hypothetical protein
MKPLYLIASSSDGYTCIHYTFNQELAQKFCDEDEDFYGMDSGPDVLMVPDDMTYEDLGITDPLEADEE